MLFLHAVQILYWFNIDFDLERKCCKMAEFSCFVALPFLHGDGKKANCACTYEILTIADQSEICNAYLVSV